METKTEVDGAAYSFERRYKGTRARLTTCLAVAAAAYHILYVTGALAYAGIYVLAVPHRALSLASFLALGFLIRPMRKKSPRHKLPWYDLLFAVTSIPGCLYIFAFYEKWILNRPGVVEGYEIFLAALTAVGLLEMTRRYFGWVIPVLSLLFIFYALYSNFLPGILHGRGYSLSRIVGHIYLMAEGMWGIPMGVASTVLISFIIFAQFLTMSGLGDFFVKLGYALVGHVRGGPAKVAIVTSALVGTIQGTAVSNVVTTGTFTIPLMKRIGYKPHFAAAIEAVASTGGQIMPPVMGAVAFLIAEYLAMPYVKVCLAALLPAILYYFCLFVMVDLEAAKSGMKGVSKSERPRLSQVMREGWRFLVPIAILLLLMVVVQYAPEKAALISVASLVIVSLFRKETRIGLKRFVQGLEVSIRSTVMIVVVCGTVGLILGPITLTGIGANLASAALQMAQGNLMILLILVALASYVLGMGIGSIPIYIMVATITAPSLVQFGAIPLAAHFFVFYWAMIAQFTPPVCPASYAAAAIAGTDPFRTGLTAMRLGIITFVVPFAFVYSPVLLMIGSPAEIVVAIVRTLAGTIAFAVALEGYLLHRTEWWERAFMLLAGALLFMFNWVADAVGVSLALPVLLKQALVLRRQKQEIQG